MSPFLLADILYFAGLALFGTALGFIAFVVFDLRQQDRAQRERAAARANRSAGAR